MLANCSPSVAISDLVAIVDLISVMSSATAAKPRSTVARITSSDALRFLVGFFLSAICGKYSTGIVPRWRHRVRRRGGDCRASNMLKRVGLAWDRQAMDSQNVERRNWATDSQSGAVLGRGIERWIGWWFEGAPGSRVLRLLPLGDTNFP
jgi:hypothetical protein